MLQILPALVFFYTPQGLLPGVRENGTEPPGGPLAHMEPADLLIILRPCPVDIHPHCPVGMNVQKSRHNPLSRHICHLSVCSRQICSHSGDNSL